MLLLFFWFAFVGFCVVVFLGGVIVLGLLLFLVWLLCVCVVAFWGVRFFGDAGVVFVCVLSLFFKEAV